MFHAGISQLTIHILHREGNSADEQGLAEGAEAYTRSPMNTGSCPGGDCSEQWAVTDVTDVTTSEEIHSCGPEASNVC